MIPISLTIEGLYSYKEPQTIDFKTLTEAGLFGIFGSVGSGKSSILEAISYALYGETERMNKDDRRGYNMMNLHANKVKIEFVFGLTDEKEYLFTANWRRGRIHENISTIERKAFEKIGTEWVPLQSNDASKILGLDYDNFKRTIIIPQGQFREFLDLKDKARSEMLKQIFNLHQFDLSEKTARLKKQTELELSKIVGGLQVLQNVHAEDLSQKQAAYAEILPQIQSNETLLKQHQASINLLTIEKKNFEDLQIKTDQLAELEAEKTKNDATKQKLAQYDLAQHQFADILGQDLEINSAAKTVHNELQNKLSAKSAHERTLSEIEKEWKAIQKQFDDLPIEEAKKTELADLKNLKHSREKIATLDTRLQRGQIAVVAEENIKAQKIAERNEVQLAIQQKKSEILNSHLLVEVALWYENNSRMQAELDKLTTAEQAYKNQKKELGDLLQRLGYVENFEDNYQEETQRIAQSLEALENEARQLAVKQELSNYANNLENGEPCPLCGALEHPSVAHLEDVSDALSKIIEDNQKLLTSREVLVQNQLDIKDALQKLKDVDSKSMEHAKEIQALTDKFKAHQENFTWTDFNKEDKQQFLDQKLHSHEAEKVVKEKEKELQAVMAAIETSEQNVRTYTEKLEEFRRELQQENGVVTVLGARLQHYHEDSFSIEEIEQEQNKIQANITATKANYQASEKQLNDTRLVLARLEQDLSNLEAQKQNLQLRRTDLDKKIHERLTANGFADLELVQQILQQELDASSMKNAITEFEKKFQHLDAEVQSLESKTDPDFSLEVFDIAQENLNKVTAVQQQLSNQQNLLKKEIEDLTQQLAQKQDLLAKEKTLQTRMDNLKTMASLFNGHGFVNYVSNVYMAQICALANERFHRFTNNQLSLVLREDKNEIEVMDYLNGGKRRSAKTLSGGQGFQASLSLALALAESVQSLNRFDKNFFFIDEGFGTQDKDSIETVFQTLEQLHKENRIVGIISHVEELQERIPRYLNVRKDEEKGSVIEIF